MTNKLAAAGGRQLRSGLGFRGANEFVGRKAGEVLPRRKTGATGHYSRSQRRRQLRSKRRAENHSATRAARRIAIVGAIGCPGVIVLVAVFVNGVTGMTMSLRRAVLRKARSPAQCKRSRRCEDADGIGGDESHRHPTTHDSRETDQHRPEYTYDNGET
ncbi:MAG TPA: hypothetical protein VFK79_12110 [Xanthobacteraceae bacterium]|nr:hypothetical protein [Xanthobacteraceae bacterium]